MRYEGNGLIRSGLLEKKEGYYEGVGLKVGDENGTYDR